MDKNINQPISAFYEARKVIDNIERIKSVENLDEIKEGTTLFFPGDGDSFDVIDVQKLITHPGMVYILEGIHAPGYADLDSHDPPKMQVRWTGSREFEDQNMIAEKFRCLQQHLLGSNEVYLID